MSTVLVTTAKGRCIYTTELESSVATVNLSHVNPAAAVSQVRFQTYVKAQLTTADAVASWSELLPSGRNWLPGVHTALVLR